MGEEQRKIIPSPTGAASLEPDGCGSRATRPSPSGQAEAHARRASSPIDVASLAAADDDPRLITQLLHSAQHRWTGGSVAQGALAVGFPLASLLLFASLTPPSLPSHLLSCLAWRTSTTCNTRSRRSANSKVRTHHPPSLHHPSSPSLPPALTLPTLTPLPSHLSRRQLRARPLHRRLRLHPLHPPPPPPLLPPHLHPALRPGLCAAGSAR